MTRAGRVLAAALVAGQAAAWWQLNRKIDEHHEARLAESTATYRAVSDAISDIRADRLVADVKTAPMRRRRT